MSFKKIFTNIISISKKKRISAKILSENEFPMSGGLWIVGSEFSRKYSLKQLPPPLDTVKQWGGWRTGGVLRFFVSIVEVLVYPWFVHVEGSDNAELSSDVVLINRMLEPVGFDLDFRKVIRKSTVDHIESLSVAIFNLSKIYTCVPFDFDEDSGYVVEDMLIGVAFSAAEKSLRYEAVLGFLNGLIKAESIVRSEEYVSDWKDMSLKLVAKLPNAVRLEVANKVKEISRNAKFSWVHGDLFGENIIIKDSEEVIVIDYDKSGIAPSFTDIMTLFVFEARTLQFDLMDNFFSGNFDNYFKVLGVSVVGNNDLLDRVSVFISWLGWKVTTEEFSEINLSRFFAVLNRYLYRDVDSVPK